MKNLISREFKITCYLYFKIIYNSLNPFQASNAFSFKKRKTKNRIVYMADGNIIHGGVIDRFKGILTSYYFSKKHKTPLSIFYTTPINYSNFWHSESINTSKLYLHPFKFKIWFIPSLKSLKILDELNIKEFQKKTNLFYLGENILAYKYKNGEWEQPTRDLYFELDALGKNYIKPSFEKKFPHYASKSFEILHFRCLNYLNDFDDSKIPGLEENKIKQVLGKLLNYLDKKYDHLEQKVFLSDSRRLLEYFHNKGYNVFDLNETKHIDNPGHRKEEYMSAYQENYLISQSKATDSYIFYYKREQPFNSHFAYYPAIFGDVPFKKYGYNLENYEIIKLKGEK